MNYDVLINIAVKEIYDCKCKLVLIYNQDNYTFVKYPESMMDVRWMINKIPDISQVVLGVCKEDGEVVIIRSHTSVYLYAH